MSSSVQPGVLIIAKADDAEAMREMLAGAGYRVTVSDGADHPAQRIELEFPAAVVLSLQLAAVDGGEVLREIRDQRHGGTVPLVLLADEGPSPPTLAEAVQRGADQLLLRPVAAESLLAKLEAVIDDFAPDIERLFEEETGEELTEELTADGEPTPSRLEPDRLSKPLSGSEGGAGARPEEPPVARGSLSSLHRELQREIDALDRQIFPDAEEPYRVVDDEDADLDGLEQFDLEALGVASLPDVAGGGSKAGAAPTPRRLLREEHLLSAVWEPLAPSGELATTSVPSLLVELNRRGFSGRLVLRRDDAVKTVRIEGGYPIFSTSNLPCDRLIELLLREGRIGQEQFEQHEEWDTGSGRALAARLVEEGVLTAEEAPVLVRQHAAENIYSLFSWTTGRYELHAEDSPVGEMLRLDVHPAALVVEGIRRKYSEDRLAELIGPPSVRPDASAAGAEVLRCAGLTPEEQQIVALLDGTQTIAQVAEGGALDRLCVYQLVYALRVLGLCVFEARQPSDGASGIRDPEIDRQRVRAKYVQVREGDYFSLLGLLPDASAYEVAAAHRRMRERFDARQLPPEVADELADELAEIAEVLDEALCVLSDEARREAYRRMA